MLDLRPCTACQRHVAITEAACPFCSASLVETEPRSMPLGRLSRAALFAGAALATAACGGKAKPDPNLNTNDNTTQTADAGLTEAPAPDAAEVVQPQRRLPNMPYGAPPARRRVV